MDGDARFVEIWRPEDRFPVIELERLVWHPVRAEAPFVIELAELFRPIYGREAAVERVTKLLPHADRTVARG